MPVTVKVNGVGNSLVHKGSNGISTATIPDVCKTPSPGGPVPVPYPNISQSATLAKGSTTVKADGMMIAIKGSEFSLSNGDNAGVAGGVKSSTFMKESTWILYSFDVKIDGKNACRLTDKKFQNHENAADLAGILQTFLALAGGQQATPAQCKELVEKVKLLVGEGRKGKVDGVRGLEERMQDQITGKGGPSDPMDRAPTPQFPKGSNSWMRHDQEIVNQQKNLDRHLKEYDEHCKAGPPLDPPNARSWVTKPRPKPTDWKGP